MLTTAPYDMSYFLRATASRPLLRQNIQHTPVPRASATFFCFLPIIDRTVGLYTSCLGDIASDMEVGRGLCELIGVRLD